MKANLWLNTLILTSMFIFAKSGNRDHVCAVDTIVNGRVSIVCFHDRDSVFLLRDMSRGHGIITLHGDKDGSEDFRSMTPDWKLDSMDRGALDVHYCVSKTYDFYKEVLDLNSLDGSGCAIYSYVNDPASKDNAKWTGRQLRIGTNSQTGQTVVSLDIIGHELSHALIANTCRLVTQGEAGAINESICDILGKSLEFWVTGKNDDWVIGSQAGLRLRDISDPHKFRQPENYNDTTFWYSGPQPEVSAHMNSTVGSHMFYLLIHGGKSIWSGKVYQIKPISLMEADQIIYLSFTKYLSPKSTYKDWRIACESAAKELFGIKSKQAKSIESAWQAVGVEK